MSEQKNTTNESTVIPAPTVLGTGGKVAEAPIRVNPSEEDRNPLLELEQELTSVEQRLADSEARYAALETELGSLQKNLEALSDILDMANVPNQSPNGGLTLEERVTFLAKQFHTATTALTTLRMDCMALAQSVRASNPEVAAEIRAALEKSNRLCSMIVFSE